MKRTQLGFSLLELLVTLSIAGILLGIGVPSYRYVTNSNRVSAEVNGLLMDLQFARSEAIKEGRNVVVCPAAAGPVCNATSSWQNGWIVFNDLNGNGAYDAGTETILRNQASFNNTDTFVSDNGVQSVTFNREGFTAGMPATPSNYVTVTLHDATANPTWSRCLQITTLGNLTTQRKGQGNCQ